MRVARLFAVLAVPAIATALVNGCSTTAMPGAAADGQTGYLKTGPCQVEGQKNTCHVETGRSGDIVNCFSGTQTCHDGAWGPCGDGSGTVTAVNTSAMKEPGGGDGLSPLAVVTFATAADAGGCVANPCNPYCLGIDTDAGSMQPDGGFTTTVVLGSVIDYNSFPTAKKGANANPTCTMGSPPSNYMNCNYDYCCARTGDAGTSGTCQKWIDTPATCVPTSARDFTTGVGCKDSNGVSHIPVCNRGQTDATSGTLLLAGYTANPNQVSTNAICANTGSTPAEGCTINLATKPIAAGKCIDINVSASAAGSVPGMKCNSAADFGNGNRTTQVNPPGVTFANLPNLGSGSYTQLAEADSCNNYSFVFTQTGSCATYGVQPPPPSSATFVYTATCPVGNKPIWNQFAYSTQVPTDSEIIFQAHTAPYTADGGTGTFTPFVQVADIKSASSPDPAVCSMSGSPAGCPKNLTTLLGAGPAQNPILEIGITEIANTAIPTVGGWQVTFSCIPSE